MEEIDSYNEAKGFYENRFVPGLILIIQVLRCIADDIQKVVRGHKIGSVTYSGVGIVGGICAIAGIVAAPFTFGGSLALTIGGVAAGVSSGVAGVTHGIVKVKLIKSKLTDAETNLRKYEDICLQMRKYLDLLKKDIDQIKNRIRQIDLSQSGSDDILSEPDTARVKHSIIILVSSMKALDLQKFAANSAALSRLIKIGKALDGALAVSKVAKGAMGTVAAIGIIVDLTTLISDAIELARIEKGKLCEEAQKLETLIKEMEQEMEALDKCFQ